MSQHTPQTSLSMLRRMADRDEFAWEQFTLLYSPLVSDWLRLFGVSEEQDSDVRQQVLSRVAASLQSFDAHRKDRTFRGWMYRITQHIAYDHLQKQNITPQAVGGTDALDALHQLPENIDELTESTRQELLSLRRRALNILKTDFEEQTWRAFWRCAIDGLKSTEVAVELKMTPAAVRKAKSRVLLRLREEFDGLLS